MAARRLRCLGSHINPRPVDQLSPASAAGATAAAAFTTTTETTLHGRAALTLKNGCMEISTCLGGGFIGAVQLTTGDPKTDVNPMRVPDYQTIDPHSYDPNNGAQHSSHSYRPCLHWLILATLAARNHAADHRTAYGSDVQGRLMSGYMGHFTCFPQFGNSADEVRH